MKEVNSSKNNRKIVLSSAQIPLKNIKNYGILSERFLYEKIYQKKQLNKIKALFYKLRNFIFGISAAEYEAAEEVLPAAERGRYKRYRDDSGQLKVSKEPAAENSFFYKSVEYLYITTDQNDNFTFRADIVKFDIHEKCKELDYYFQAKDTSEK